MARLRACFPKSLAKYGVVVMQGMVQFGRMITSFDEAAAGLPAQILSLCRAYIGRIALFDDRIGALDQRSKAGQKQMTQHNGS